MAWRKLLALGFVAGVVAVGCTVTSDDGDGDDSGLTDDGGDGSGGDEGAGGAGGKATGGSGGKAAAGGAGTGGAAEECNPAGETDACQKCVETKCCQEYLDCNTDECAGTSTSDGELVCFQDCMGAALADAGSADDQTYQDCLGNCAEGAVITTETEDLVTCMVKGVSAGTDGGNDGCSVECYGVDLTN